MDDVITLIKETVAGHDADLNEIRTVTKRDVFCKVDSVRRNEFYAAAAVNMKPEFVITLSDFEEYEGEQLAEYDGVEYTIIRTYRNTKNLNELELVLERKISNEGMGERTN